MNINCIICSDLFGSTSAVFATRCGHMFHYTCLIQWIERSKTCPQCRSKASEKTINRIYFNIPSADGIVDDAVTLQSKLDNANLQLRLNENHVKTTEEKIQLVTDENAQLNEKIKELKCDLEKSKSGIKSLKEQISFYKIRADLSDKLEIELQQTKEQLRAKEATYRAITGSLEEAQEVLNTCDSADTLSVIANSLKKELQIMQRKKNNLFLSFKRNEKELLVVRKENTALKEENEILQSNLKEHKQCEIEIQTLKIKISELMENSSLSAKNPRLQRVLAESPAPRLTKPKDKISSDNISFEEIDSPSVSFRVKEIQGSDSPYLTVKLNNMGSFMQESDAVSRFGASGYSIFKKSTSTGELKTSKTASEGCYDGFGGRYKDDPFPVPKPKPTGIKRTKSSTKLSQKFKKLAKPNNKKLDDFLNISDMLDED